MATTPKTVLPRAPEEVLLSQDFVFTGRRIQEDGKPGTSLRLIGYEGGTQNLDSLQRLYNGKHCRTWIVGGVYTGAAFSANLAQGLPNVKFVRLYGTLEDRAPWIAKDAEVDVDLKAEKLRKDAIRFNEIERVMEPLRAVYQSMYERGDVNGCRAMRTAVEVALYRRVPK